MAEIKKIRDEMNFELKRMQQGFAAQAQGSSPVRASNANCQSQFQGDNRTQPDRDNRDRRFLTLDETYFRRMDKYDEDPTKFRGWLFDLLVTIGKGGSKLGKGFENHVKARKGRGF